MPMLPVALTDYHSAWWHRFRTARWYAAACTLLIDPRHRAAVAASPRMARTSIKMKRRQARINHDVNTLKTLMDREPEDWDAVAIDRAMARIHQLLRAQELDGRDLLAAAVDMTFTPPARPTPTSRPATARSKRPWRLAAPP